MVSGVGCTEMYVDHNDTGMQLFHHDRVHSFDVRWDPRSRKQNFEDREWDLRARWMSAEDLAYMFGEGEVKNLLQLDSPRWNDAFGDPLGGIQDQTFSFLYLDDHNEARRPKNQALVTDYQYWVREDAYLIRYPDGTTSVHFKDELDDATLMMMMQQGIDPDGMQEISARRWYRAFIVGDKVIKHELLVPNCPTRSFITGFEDNSDQVYTDYFGFVARMMDPQRWVNKLLSQLLYIMSVNPKGALLAEVGAAVDPHKLQRDFASPDSVVWLNPGGLGRIDTAKPISLPTGMMDMMQFSIGMVPQSAHVNTNIMGGGEDDLKRTAASSIELIQKAGQSSLASFTDSLRRYRKTTGRKYLKHFQKFADPSTMVRLGGEATMEFAQLGTDPLYHQYDVVIDESPDSLTSQMQMWQTFTDQGLLKEMLQMGMFPMQILPRMIPGMDEQTRRAWEQHIQMSMGGGGGDPAQQGQAPPQ
jgi:hypothetical protein